MKKKEKNLKKNKKHLRVRVYMRPRGRVEARGDKADTGSSRTRAHVRVFCFAFKSFVFSVTPYLISFDLELLKNIVKAQFFLKKIHFNPIKNAFFFFNEKTRKKPPQNRLKKKMLRNFGKTPFEHNV